MENKNTVNRSKMPHQASQTGLSPPPGVCEEVPSPMRLLPEVGQDLQVVSVPSVYLATFSIARV